MPGQYLEASERSRDQDLREARARWKNIGPTSIESDALPIAGFRGVMIQQPASPATQASSAVQAGNEWFVDGDVDGDFGTVRSGGSRLLVWATDGRIAIQIRAFASSDSASSMQALMRVLESIRPGSD